MADSHDQAARRIAKRYGGRYRPTLSPDVKTPKIRVEVKSNADEIPTALRQLGGGKGAAYIALPSAQKKEALKRLSDRKTGLMNMKGDILKSSMRKKK